MDSVCFCRHKIFLFANFFLTLRSISKCIENLGMNIYVRYFDKEILVSSVDEVLDFLQSLQDIDVDEYLVKDLKGFVEGNNMYPKRYKVRGRNYFIVIKTSAKNMEEFKNNGNSARAAVGSERASSGMKPDDGGSKEELPGWYTGSLLFKRVIPIPQTQKFQYVDTLFVAKVKAFSRVDCYNKIVNHLRARNDIDLRSQFPSSKGRNFECRYEGMTTQI